MGLRHTVPVRSTTSPNEQTLAPGPEDSTVRVQNALDSKCLRTLGAR